MCRKSSNSRNSLFSAGRHLRLRLWHKHICCRQIWDLSHRKGRRKILCNTKGAATDRLGTHSTKKVGAALCTLQGSICRQFWDLSHAKRRRKIPCTSKGTVTDRLGTHPTKKVGATFFPLQGSIYK